MVTVVVLVLCGGAVFSLSVDSRVFVDVLDVVELGATSEVSVAAPALVAPGGRNVEEPSLPHAVPASAIMTERVMRGRVDRMFEFKGPFRRWIYSEMVGPMKQSNSGPVEQVVVGEGCTRSARFSHGHRVETRQPRSAIQKFRGYDERWKVLVFMAHEALCVTLGVSVNRAIAGGMPGHAPRISHPGHPMTTR